MQLMQRQLRFSGGPETSEDHAALEHNAELLKSFEQKQEARKKKLIEMAKAAGKSEAQEAPKLVQTKSEIDKRNEEKLNSFLISKKQV